MLTKKHFSYVGALDLGKYMDKLSVPADSTSLVILLWWKTFVYFAVLMSNQFCHIERHVFCLEDLCELDNDKFRDM